MTNYSQQVNGNGNDTISEEPEGAYPFIHLLRVATGIVEVELVERTQIQRGLRDLIPECLPLNCESSEQLEAVNDGLASGLGRLFQDIRTIKKQKND
jgi:hypothetical protein